jgi:hypothetical protein
MHRTAVGFALFLGSFAVSSAAWSDSPPVCSLVQTFPALNSPAYGSHATAADMNGDGIADLVCWSEEIRVMAGSRTGEFSEIAGMRIIPIFEPYDIDCGDVNGDGRPDLVVTGASVRCGDGSCLTITYTGEMQVFLNDSTGFVAQPLQSSGSDVPEGATLADLNSDGHLDLVLTMHLAWNPSSERDDTDAIMILAGDGTGAFTPIGTADAGVTNGVAIVSDLTFDQLPDIAFASQSAIAARVLPGLGGFEFGGPVDYPVRSIPHNVVAADLNADGFDDLVVERYFNPLSLFLSKSADGFAPAEEFDTADGGDFTVGDIDGDGDPDLVAVAASVFAGFGEAFALRNDGAGQLLEPEPLHVGDRAQLARIADFDGDGLPDVAGLRGWTIFFERGRGDLGLHAPRSLDPFPAGWLDVGDIDGDGDPDFVSSSQSSIRVRKNDGTGNFTSILYADGINGQTHQPHLVDLNADGVLDLVVTGSGQGSSGMEVSLLMGQPGGTFALGLSLDTGFTQAYESAIGDVDGDGDLDIAVTVFKTGGIFGVQVFRSTGSFTFAAPEFLPTAGAWSASAGDLDEDGRDEFVVTSASTGRVYVVGCDGNGPIAFQQEIDLGGQYAARTGALGDIDHDGDLDFVVVRANALQTLLNDGTGTLALAMTLPISNDGYAMSLADVTGDGVKDVVVVHFGLSLQGVSVLEGHSDGTFTQLGFFSGRSSADVIVADFDQDGDADIVTAGDTPMLYESQLTLLRAADLDCDGVVGASDLAVLLGAWGQPGDADLDGDGVVGASDLAELLGAWSA